MQALAIIIMIVAVLGFVGMGVLSVISFAKRIARFAHLLLFCGFGALVLSAVMGMIPVLATAIISLILSIPGWGAVITGFILLEVRVWKVIAPEPKPQRYYQQAPQQAQQPQQPPQEPPQNQPPAQG
jgi:hypothetical protein